jgi:hypothetical protein
LLSAAAGRLHGVLQHEGAEKSGHETITAEQDAWTSLSQLAAEYGTIAQAAEHDRFVKAVACSGLDPEQAEAVADGESFGSLVAQLHRAHTRPGIKWGPLVGLAVVVVYASVSSAPPTSASAIGVPDADTAARSR